MGDVFSHLIVPCNYTVTQIDIKLTTVNPLLSPRRGGGVIYFKDV